MNRFHSAGDAERRIANLIADELRRVRAEVQDPLAASQDIQAASLFINTVCPCACEAYWMSDRLYGIAVMLADCIDHDAEGMPLAGTLRAWVAGVEKRRR